MNAVAAHAIFFSPSVNVRAQARVGYTCVYVYHFYVCVYSISNVWVVHMRYIIYILCAYLRRGKKTSNGKNLLHCEIS